MRFVFLSAILVFGLSFSVFCQQPPAIKDNAAVGNVAPDFTAVALSGNTYRLEDLKGKVVVLNFWSTKCVACAYETNELNKLVETYKGKNVVFLGFAQNAKENIEKFTKKKPFKYEIIPASMQMMIVPYGKPMSNGFYDMPFPLHVVINQKGIVEVNREGIEGVGAVRDKLQQLLKTDNSKIQ